MEGSGFFKMASTKSMVSNKNVALNGASKVISESGNVLSKFASFTVKSKEFLIALGVLAAFILLIVLIIYGARVMHPRGIFIRRSENLDKIMATFIADMRAVEKKYRRVQAKQKLSPVNTALSSMGGVMDFIASPSFAQDIETYFKYQSIFNNVMDEWLFTNIFKEFKQFSPTRNNEDGKVRLQAKMQRTREFIARVENVRSEIDAIEKKVYTIPSNNVDKAAYVDVCAGFRMIDALFAHYSPVLMAMYENRRFSFFNYLVFLVRPHYEKLVVEQVIVRWRDALRGASVDQKREEFRVWWDGLRQKILNLATKIWEEAKKLVENE
jgi:hypothetical protein